MIEAPVSSAISCKPAAGDEFDTRRRSRCDAGASVSCTAANVASATSRASTAYWPPGEQIREPAVRVDMGQQNRAGPSRRAGPRAQGRHASARCRRRRRPVGWAWEFTMAPILSVRPRRDRWGRLCIRARRVPHRLSDGLVTWVGCTLEPMARGSPQGEHELMPIKTGRLR